MSAAPDTTDQWVAEEAAVDTAPANGHRPLPRHDDLEAACLGAALINPQTLAEIRATGITPDEFRDPTLRRVARAIFDIDDTGDFPDPVLIDQAITLTGGTPPGRDTYERLAYAPAGTYAAGAYARAVRQLHHQRQVVAAADAVTRSAGTPAWPAALDTLTQLTAGGEPATTAEHPWDDVAGAMRGTIERVTPDHLIRTDGTALMYPGRLHWLMGEPGKGKTWVALHAAHQLLEIDIGRVVYLDWENSRDLIADRLNTLGADPDRVEHQLRYTRSPTLDPTWIANLAASIEDGPNTLTVIDGAAPSIASGGWKEKDESDVLAWLDRIVWPLTATGAAVLVLDHVTKDRETRGLWPRGSGAKSGAVDGAAWLYRVRKPFSRLTAGHADLIQAKDREGVNGEDGTPVASFHATPQGPDKPTLFELRPPAATTSPDGAFRPTILMERLSRHIEAENRYNRRPTRTELVGGPRGETAQVKGKKAHLSQALEVLLDEGWVTVDTAGRSNLHTSERPYRETDDAPPGGAGGTEDQEEF